MGRAALSLEHGVAVETHMLLGALRHLDEWTQAMLNLKAG